MGMGAELIWAELQIRQRRNLNLDPPSIRMSAFTPQPQSVRHSKYHIFAMFTPLKQEKADLET